MDDRRRFNPLVLDPDNYDQLFDQDFSEEEEKPKDEVYEPMSYGARRKRPIQTDY